MILLDEPFASLDSKTVSDLPELVHRWHGEKRTVVAVLHDLGLAAAYADRVAVISGGRIVADGPPASVLDPALLSTVYDHPIEVVRHPVSGALSAVVLHGGVWIRLTAPVSILGAASLQREGVRHHVERGL